MSRVTRRVSVAWPLRVLATVLLLFAITLIPADGAFALGADSGRAKTKPWRIASDGLGATKLGPLNLTSDSLPSAGQRIGAPTKSVVTSAGSCKAKWKKIGLTLTFVGPGPSLDPCGSEGRVYSAVARGKRAKNRYESPNGLRIGARSATIERKHPDAQRQSKRNWWLERAYSSLLGAEFGVVQARVSDSRVVGLVAVAGAQPVAIGSGEAGVWQGPVQGDSSQYSLSMALRPGPALPGERVGSIDYELLDCGGSLTILDRTLTRIHLAETIIYGKARCVDTGIITIVLGPRSGRWSYVGTSPDDDADEPTAEITRSELPVDVSDRIDPAEAGNWQGPVLGDSSNYHVELSLISGPATPETQVGQIRYPELSCGGTLTYVGRTHNRVVLRETITTGTSQCVVTGEVTISLRTGGARFRYVGQDTLTSDLVRP